MLASGSEFLEEIKRELLKDSIFVFTPEGDVVELPAGIHPAGFRVRRAHGGGQPLRRRQGGRRHRAAHAMSSRTPRSWRSSPPNTAKPNIDWLKAVRTSKAKSKIRQWLVTNGQALVIDRNVVARRKTDASGIPRPRGRPARSRESPEKGYPETRSPVPETERSLGLTEIHPYVPKAVFSSDKAGISVSGRSGPDDPVRRLLSAHHRGSHSRLCVPRPGHHRAPEGLPQPALPVGLQGAGHRSLLGDPTYPGLTGASVSSRNGCRISSERWRRPSRRYRDTLWRAGLEEDGDRLVGWFTVRWNAPRTPEGGAQRPRAFRPY